MWQDKSPLIEGDSEGATPGSYFNLSKLFRNVLGLNSLEMSSGSDPVHNAVSLWLVARWRNLGAKRRGFATWIGIVRALAELWPDCLGRGCQAAGIDAKGARALVWQTGLANGF